MRSALRPNGKDGAFSVTRQPLRVAVGGGNAVGRAAVKEVFSHLPGVETEIVEFDDSQPAPEHELEVPLAAILLDPAEQQKWPAALQMHLSKVQRPLVVGLLADLSPELIRAALRAGADDVFSTPLTAAEVLRALLRAIELRRRAQEPKRSTVCSLVSVSGGLGVSHLTVNLGLAARRMLEKRTALIDLDLQAAPLSAMLEIAPEHTISELADPTSPIDSIRLESVLSKHESGLSLLAAPKLIEQAELVSAATVEAALKVLRDLFDVILIDCGTHLNESAVVAFEHSDRLLYVLNQSVIAVRAAQRFFNLYRRLGLKEVQPELIVNRYRASDPIRLEQIESALQLPVFATVPRDDPAFLEMQISGRDLWKISSGSSVRDAVEKLTRKLFVPDQETASRPRLLSRLIAGFRR
jgi:pilus assembly protein CpaE